MTANDLNDLEVKSTLRPNLFRHYTISNGLNDVNTDIKHAIGSLMTFIDH